MIISLTLQSHKEQAASQAGKEIKQDLVFLASFTNPAQTSSTSDLRSEGLRHEIWPIKAEKQQENSHERKPHRSVSGRRKNSVFQILDRTTFFLYKLLIAFFATFCSLGSMKPQSTPISENERPYTHTVILTLSNSRNVRNCRGKTLLFLRKHRTEAR